MGFQLALSAFQSRFHARLGVRPGPAGYRVGGKRTRSGGSLRDLISHMVSVVIPTYNEAGCLSATLDSVANSKAKKEVIVVDAGSQDGTPEEAVKKGSRLLLSTRRQRAYQMNAGAQQARGCFLLFLHADTVLPASALDNIESFLSKNQIVGGGFARRYDSNSWFLRTTCLLADLPIKRTDWFLRDH